MENLVFLALLACPLMMVAMIFFMRGGHGKDNKDNHERSQAIDLQKDMNKLMEQNQELAKEIESMKRSR